MWANQWNASYQKAREMILLRSGGNFTWHKGETENGCETCARLDGITMSAAEWQALQLHPRGYPNPKLQCEGGGPANNCDCTLDPTDKRRTPGGYGKVEEILLVYGRVAKHYPGGKDHEQQNHAGDATASR